MPYGYFGNNLYIYFDADDTTDIIDTINTTDTTDARKGVALAPIIRCRDRSGDDE